MSRSKADGVARALAELEKDQSRVRSQIGRILSRLERDPIAPLDLRYTETEGFTSKPIRFKGKILTGEFYLLPQKESKCAGTWSPSFHRAGPTEVTPVGALLCPWGIIVAVRIGHDQADFRPKMEFTRSRAGTGSVYLADPVNNQYLELISASFDGEVVAGIPRTGLLAFEFPGLPTDRLQMHFSDVALSPNGAGRSSFHLEYSQKGLSEDLAELLNGPAPAELAEEILEKEVDRVRQKFLRQQSGCATGTVLFTATAAILQRWLVS